MKRLTIALGAILALNALYAETKHYSVEEFLHIRFEGQEALAVYEALNLPEEQLSEGKGKSFVTLDKVVSMECFDRHYNVEPFACHFTFDLRGLSPDTVVKSELKGLRFILSRQDSQNLERALLAKEPLEIDGGKLTVECTQRSDSKCSVFVAL